jgi:thiamine kinase-like enzyme
MPGPAQGRAAYLSQNPKTFDRRLTRLRSITDAITPEEKRLAEVVATHADWHGCHASFQIVNGGISNANFRLRVDGGPHDFFVKLPGVGTELFIDRNAAHEASLKAAACGFGAPVCGFDAERGVEIFAFVEGWRASNNLDFQRASVRRNALLALKSFNDQPLLALTKTVFDMVDEHVDQAQRFGCRLPPDFSWMMREYEAARSALTSAGLDLAPCMNDTLAGNFMLDADDAVMLVDFEYASNNDRAYELALFFGEMFFTEQAEQELIALYFGQADARILARISVFQALADIKWSTWAMVQAKLSAIEFDYHKYGLWKYFRARKAMRHPNWGLWLATV